SAQGRRQGDVLDALERLGDGAGLLGLLGEALEVGVLDTVDLRGDGQLDAGDPTLADVEGDRRGGVHEVGGVPFSASMLDSCIVRQVACADPRSSSGEVVPPSASSERAFQVTGKVP